MKRQFAPIGLALNESQLKAVSEMLDSGMPVTKVARHMQGTWGVYKDMPEAGVVKRVRNFLTKHVNQDKDDRIGREIRKKGINRFNANVNVLQELYELHAIQKARVGKALMMENKTSLLMASVQGEIRCQADILSRIAAVHLDTGILPRAPKNLKGEITDPHGRVMKFDWTESDDSLVRLIESEDALEGEAEETEEDVEAGAGVATPH
ncbi:hypothetical protein [Roseococcus pinisoli]|uniref:Terminase small subunit n=1 Tax=Roseococcus pinisoli TaxID=2835040 RepID=A0ABS5QHE2_9PROT|nr:hypothetical protein [Roseococcus pinisoli]MBS7812375.1 hypothetical protein [Roseococcus pinisoli]